MAQPPAKRARVGEDPGWLNNPTSSKAPLPQSPWGLPPVTTSPSDPPPPPSTSSSPSNGSLPASSFTPAFPPTGFAPPPPAEPSTTDLPPWETAAPPPPPPPTEGDSSDLPPWQAAPPPPPAPSPQQNYYQPPPPEWPPAPPPPAMDSRPPPPQDPKAFVSAPPPPPATLEPEPQPQPTYVPLSLQYEDVTEEELGVIPSAATEKKVNTEQTPIIKTAVNKPLRLKKDKEKHLKTEKERLARNQSKVGVRRAAEKTWVDPTMAEWPENDFRMFVGDLGNEVTDDQLRRAFSKYPSMVKVKVLRDQLTGRTRGFGFVSFLDPMDFAKAMKEMNGKYIGNRPCKLSRSTWKNREISNVLEKEKKRKNNKIKF